MSGGETQLKVRGRLSCKRFELTWYLHDAVAFSNPVRDRVLRVLYGPLMSRANAGSSIDFALFRSPPQPTAGVRVSLRLACVVHKDGGYGVVMGQGDSYNVNIGGVSPYLRTFRAVGYEAHMRATALEFQVATGVRPHPYVSTVEFIWPSLAAASALAAPAGAAPAAEPHAAPAPGPAVAGAAPGADSPTGAAPAPAPAPEATVARRPVAAPVPTQQDDERLCTLSELVECLAENLDTRGVLPKLDGTPESTTYGLKAAAGAAGADEDAAGAAGADDDAASIGSAASRPLTPDDAQSPAAGSRARHEALALAPGAHAKPTLEPPLPRSARGRNAMPCRSSDGETALPLSGACDGDSWRSKRS
ncbi:hypothetical protein KFE25_005016 [Diacronema lutheri]|uniref:Uncharacterized protein n=1 Tax=Diacronema lutheri TaxID=2081491 RepID=A0A8J6CBA7_DIALT|nr:hypothetical protein KFE25_005016 [Diacronema lutheri]